MIIIESRTKGIKFERHKKESQTKCIKFERHKKESLISSGFLKNQKKSKVSYFLIVYFITYILYKYERIERIKSAFKPCKKY